MYYFLLVVIPNIGGFLYVTIFLILSCVFISGIILLTVWGDLNDNEKIYVKKLAMICIISVLISSILACFIPSKEEIKQLIGLNYVQNIKGIEKLPKNIVHKINKLLTEKDK